MKVIVLPGLLFEGGSFHFPFTLPAKQASMGRNRDAVFLELPGMTTELDRME